MILRTLCIGRSADLESRIRSIWPQEHSELEFIPSLDELWPTMHGATSDLVLIPSAELQGEPSLLVDALRELPEPAELVILADSRSDSSEFLAAGVFAVVELASDDSALRGVFESVVSRLRDAVSARLRIGREGPFDLGDFSSESQAMAKVLGMARKVASSDSSVLVLGETGVGKEYLSRAIHATGDRASEPFVALNCAAIPDSLMESELFGHEKGAFTGAFQSRRGHFELAHGGTLFLDEIGEMPLGLQTKLLRALQERKIRRLGGEHEIAVDVRIIAATNREPRRAIEEKELREDLYYRLAVVTMRIPPLRERRADISVLFESHVEHFRSKLGRWEIEGVSAAAMKALVRYDWPGNVRELINVAERAVLLGDGPLIIPSDLPQSLSGEQPGEQAMASSMADDHILDLPLDQARSELVHRFEREYLSRLLTRSGGSIGQTAAQAGISPRTLYNKLKQLGLRKQDFKS